MDPLKPSPSLLVKLGSLIVHWEEFTSLKGNVVDKRAIDALKADPEVSAWFEQMNKMAMLPVKR